MLFKWLTYYLERHVDARVVTMPSCSGKHENMIIDHAEKQEGYSFLTLLTFDNQYSIEETGIDDGLIHETKWHHYRCVDIFGKMLQLELKEEPTAAWFDLTGGFTDKVWSGMQEVVKQQFADGSLLFVTLAIDNARGFSTRNHARRVYDSFKKEHVSRKFVTDMLLKEMVAATGKYLRPCLAPYVYKHGRATFGVFGYIVGK